MGAALSSTNRLKTVILNIEGEEPLVFTFGNGQDIVTSINGDSSLITHGSSLSGIYDLQGRKIDSSAFNIHSSLPKGIYIKKR
ncbi:MAG: hypothetical protein IJ928_00680 [Prevotella sp.]|nr:hypothetical protein [Prevotella sp.]